MKVVSILGATGSIGVSTLAVIRQFPERFRVAALAGGKNVALLAEEAREFRPALCAVLDEAAAGHLRALLGPGGPEVVSGAGGYRLAATLPEARMVVSAMVGAAGLVPTIAAIEAGKDIALANKETLVAAGGLVMGLARRHGVSILPVDSEHSAIFQALLGNTRSAVRRILLTASGGPFFRKSREELASVTPEQALKHPNWTMGRKITIDSATLMNKGLEVIEAHHLFGVPLSAIAVHIHPESIIHSMVEYVDGSVIAQMGIPDMKTPIAYALSHPERLPVENPPLDLFRLGTLSFFEPDFGKFPCLRLAFEAGERGGTAPAVMNAANEIAVHAFLERRIGFADIAALIGRVMEAHRPGGETTLSAVLEADAWARAEAARLAGCPAPRAA